MKRMLKRILVVVLVLILLAVAGFGMLYAGRLRTVNSIEQITAYDDYNLYRMDVTYDYSIDDVINYGITDNQSMIDAILKETLPLLPVLGHAGLLYAEGRLQIRGSGRAG